MAPLETLYSRRCRSHIEWYEEGKARFLGPNLVHQAIEKVRMIRERLKTAQSRQKSYVDVRQRELEFKVENWVFLKVSPMKEEMTFGKKRNLSLRYIGPYQIVRRIGNVAYELDLPTSLALVHSVFHVSMLKKCVGDHSLMVPVENISVKDFLSYKDVHIEILDC